MKDEPVHVSVKPIGAKIQEWIDAGPTSRWTQAVKSVIVKWDGRN